MQTQLNTFIDETSARARLAMLVGHHHSEAKNYAGRAGQCDDPTTAAWLHEMSNRHSCWSDQITALTAAIESVLTIPPEAVAEANRGNFQLAHSILKPYLRGPDKGEQPGNLASSIPGSSGPRNSL